MKTKNKVSASKRRKVAGNDKKKIRSSTRKQHEDAAPTFYATLNGMCRRLADE
jgi:hypothetical protein